jgi:hypothetical protein
MTQAAGKIWLPENYNKDLAFFFFYEVLPLGDMLIGRLDRELIGERQ